MAIVLRRTGRSKVPRCQSCKSKGVRTPATCVLSSEILPERTLCQSCAEETRAIPVARVGRIRSKPLVFF